MITIIFHSSYESKHEGREIPGTRIENANVVPNVDEMVRLFIGGKLIYHGLVQSRAWCYVHKPEYLTPNPIIVDQCVTLQLGKSICPER